MLHFHSHNHHLFFYTVSLSQLPVKIIFRLCTDNDQVVDFFSSLDSKLDCDVLDDFWGEVRESSNHVSLTYKYYTMLCSGCLSNDTLSF